MSSRRVLRTKKKCDLLKNYDQLINMSQRQATVKLNISQPMLHSLLKSRNDLESAVLNNENVSRKSKRCEKDEDVEAALKTWFFQVRDKDARVNGPLLRQKAEQLAMKMGKNDFQASQGWFYSWKLKPQGEQDIQVRLRDEFLRSGPVSLQNTHQKMC